MCLYCRFAHSCDSANIPESLSTQLTLFYAGTDNAFDNVTEDKVFPWVQSQNVVCYKKATGL